MLHSSLAYFDPASGSLIIQLVVAGVAGAIAYFRRAIFGVWGFFKAKSQTGEAPKEGPKAGE